MDPTILGLIRARNSYAGSYTSLGLRLWMYFKAWPRGAPGVHVGASVFLLMRSSLSQGPLVVPPI